MDNLGEINKCLEMYNVLRLNQEEIENTNKQIISNETESVKERKKKFPASKSPGSDGFMGEFYQTFRKESTPILLKLFQKITEEGMLPNSFYKASITLIPKPTNSSQIKKIIGQHH